MRFGTMTGHPTDGDNLYSIESGTPPSLGRHHYHDPVTIHLHSLTSIHIHRQSDDVTPLNNITINFDSATANTHKIPRKPVSGSSNGEPPENPGNTPLGSKASPSSATLLEGATKDCPQHGGTEDWNGLTDLDNPETWSRRKKIYHTFVPSAIAFLT
jgi:hypothetical protein